MKYDKSIISSLKTMDNVQFNVTVIDSQRIDECIILVLNIKATFFLYQSKNKIQIFTNQTGVEM